MTKLIAVADIRETPAVTLSWNVARLTKIVASAAHIPPRRSLSRLST